MQAVRSRSRNVLPFPLESRIIRVRFLQGAVFMSNACFAAADVGGTKIALGLFDGDKRPIAEKKYPSDPAATAEEFFTGLKDSLLSLLVENNREPADLKGLGVGIPGMVRSPQGEISIVAMLPGLNGFPVKAFLEDQLPGVRVEVGNDGHCAALAEARQGAGRGFPHMVYCPVSTGLSSTIIIDGKLFVGSYGYAGESGHTIVTPGEGISCGCGNRGCIQSYSSGGMIVRHIRGWIREGQPTKMLELAGSPEKIDARVLEDAARMGDEMALRALDQMALYLGTWLFNLYMTLNINCFVFGGGLINMGELLFGRIRKVFDGYRRTDEPVYFQFAQLGQRSGLLGALELLF